MLNSSEDVGLTSHQMRENYSIAAPRSLKLILSTLFLPTFKFPAKDPALSAIAWLNGGFSQCALADGNVDHVAFKMLFLSAPSPANNSLQNGEKTWLIPA